MCISCVVCHEPLVGDSMFVTEPDTINHFVYGIMDAMLAFSVLRIYGAIQHVAACRLRCGMVPSANSRELATGASIININWNRGQIIICAMAFCREELNLFSLL